MVAASTGSGRLERTGSPPFTNRREHSLNAGLASRRRGRPSYQRVVKPLLVLRYFARRSATMLTTHPRSPLRLHTLGGLSIGDGHSPTHRSRRALALMSIAASAGADGVERDRILALLTVDLWDFEYAVRIGDLERAAPLYTGPFLASFYIAGLDAFERWADGE